VRLTSNYGCSPEVAVHQAMSVEIRQKTCKHLLSHFNLGGVRASASISCLPISLLIPLNMD